MRILITAIEQILKLSQKQTMQIQRFHTFLMNKQIEKINRKN